MYHDTGNRQNGMTGDDPVFRSLEVIEERIREKLTVENLADSAHFSKYHYQRMFREAVGDSVMGYVTRRRLSLAATEDSILEIALRYGYDTHEGFTRSFRAHMGITPAEYRKYHSFTSALTVGEGRNTTNNCADNFAIREGKNTMNNSIMQEERNTMFYSKAADEIIRELNSLIVQAKETAAYAGKKAEANTEAAGFYFRFWDMMRDKTEAMADRLAQNLARVTAIAGKPDEISARFLILKSMEDIAFQSGIMAFQAGLTIARARPGHREEFTPVCDKYASLARSARIRTGRIAEFMQELSALIFQDMQKNAERKIQQAVQKGVAAEQELSEDPALPYGYIADEVRNMAGELSFMSLEEVTAACLEDDLLRLDTLAFAADVDALRTPGHSPLFEGIRVFKEEIAEAAEFFRSLPGNALDTFAEPGAGKNNSGRVFWGNTMLFYLKGEIQKLGNAHLNEEQKARLCSICNRLDEAVRLMGQRTNHRVGEDTTDVLRQVYEELTAQAEELDTYGTALRYLAEELKHMLLDPDTSAF